MKQAALNGKQMSLSFSEKTGTCLISAPPFEMSEAEPCLFLNGKKTAFGKWKITRATSRSICAEAENRIGKWKLEFSLAGSGLTLRLGGLLNSPEKDVELCYFDGVCVSTDHILSQGLKTGGCKSVLTGKKAAEEEFPGYYQLMLTRKGTQLQLSYPLQCDFLESFTVRPGKKKECTLRAGAAIKHFSGRKIDLAPLTFRLGCGFELMQGYAEENSSGKRDFSSAVRPGWNSWDYYRWTVTEDDVLANAEFIARDKVLSKHVKKIIVDDGWQYAYGEWEANGLFPHGMKYLADRIKKLGMEPGLWIAPAILEPHARISQLNPEMLARGEGGLPALCWQCMKRYGFLLDPTVEKSRQFIRDTFERLLGYGYTYFKLDFLGGLLNARQFTDTRIPRGKLMDLTIGTAYRAVAGRAQLLGCNYLLSGGPDIVDSVRVGSDIHSKWFNIKLNAVAIAARFWANKKLWVNDPDFALCRSQDTSDDPDLTRLRPCLPYIPTEETDPNAVGYQFALVDKDIYRPQMEVLLSLALASGGSINLSDNMLKLNESGLDLARRTVSAESGEAAIPQDMFASELPAFWVQKLKRGHRILLINWEDTEQERVLDFGKLGITARKAVNFWNDKPVRIVNGRIAEVLPARSCLFAVIE